MVVPVLKLKKDAPTMQMSAIECTYCITSTLRICVTFPPFDCSSLESRNPSNCSSHASLEHWPKRHRCLINIAWKTTTIKDCFFCWKNNARNHLLWNVWSWLSSLKSQRRNICLLPEGLQSSLVNPTSIAYSFYIWLPILPPRGKLSFFPLLVLLSKMLLINSRSNR